MRMRRAQKAHVRLTRQGNVVGERSFALEKALVFDAAHGAAAAKAGVLRFRGGGHLGRSICGWLLISKSRARRENDRADPSSPPTFPGIRRSQDWSPPCSPIPADAF